MRPPRSNIVLHVAMLTLAGIAGVASRASAQASLSLQGFGFPAGQMSTRTLGAGGSLAEIDPLTPVNPASVALLLTRLIYFQAEPEFRTVTSPNGTDHTTTPRYPNVFGAIPVTGSAGPNAEVSPANPAQSATAGSAAASRPNARHAASDQVTVAGRGAWSATRWRRR